MESSLKIKKQRGYLLILATVLIVIVGFIGFMLVNMFISGSGSEVNVTQAQKALYVAMSGLEMAKRDIVVNKVQCAAINGTSKYTAASISNIAGQFTVTANNGFVLTTSLTNINNTDLNPVITLNSVAGFATDGVVKIDDEIFYYTAISGNTLQNVKRGVSGSPVMAHNSGATAMQVQCALTSVGALPTIAASSAKRTVRQILPALPLNFNGYSPAVFSLGPVLFVGTPFVVNPSVWNSSTNFPGSTIVTTSTVTFNSAAAATQICSCGTSACLSACRGGGGLVESSTRTNMNAGDVVQNYTGVDSTNLFSKIFSTSKPDMQNYVINSQPTTKYFSSGLTSLSGLNGINGTTIWVNGDIDIHGGADATVGTPSNPVILIVNGSMTFHGSPKLTVNGLLYSIGNIQSSGSGSIYGAGMIVTEGTFDANGSDKMVMDPQMMEKLMFINPNMIIDYSGNAASTQEIFN